MANENYRLHINKKTTKTIAKAGDNTFTKSIVYERKLLQNVAA